MDNLESTLIRKFMNIDIQNYSYGDFEELFYIIEELVNRSFITCSYNVTNTSIDSEFIHLMLEEIDCQYSLNNKLSVLLAINNFIINDIEVCLLH